MQILGEQCRKDGYYTSQCHFIGQNKCHKCERFGYNPNNCQSSNQSLDSKRKSTSNNNSNNSKHPHTEVHNTQTRNIPQSANVVISNTPVAYHTVQADDSLEDVVSDNKLISTSYNNKRIYELYDWLADTGITSHITYQ